MEKTTRTTRKTKPKVRRSGAVPAGTDAEAQLTVILKEVTQKIENVSSISVVTGDLKPDGSSSTGEGAADYGEGHDPDEVWGIVTNDSSIPGGIRLVIEKTDNTALAPIESAAESGSLVAAEGSAQMSAEEMKALVSDKDIKTALDIYLLMSDGSRVTQFNGMYEIKLLLPAELRGMSGLQVVYVADDGKVEVFETVREGNYLTFTTAHFSEFFILGDTELDLWWLIITLSVLLAIELVAILLIALSKKKKGEDGADGGKGDAQNEGEAQDEKQDEKRDAGQKGAAAKMNMVFPPLLAVNPVGRSTRSHRAGRARPHRGGSHHRHAHQGQ